MYPPKVPEGPSQMLITSLDFSSHTGRIAIGRLQRGSLKTNQAVVLIHRDKTKTKSRIKELNLFDGLGRKKVDEVQGRSMCNSRIGSF